MPDPRFRTSLPPKVGKPYIDLSNPVPTITKYFICSHNADRSMTSVGMCQKGLWYEVPFVVYTSMKRAIEEAKVYGEDIGWKVKVETNPQEVKK